MQPSTPTRSSGKYVQKATLNTPKSSPSKRSRPQSPVHTDIKSRPVNFDDDITFLDDNKLQGKVFQVGNSYFEYGHNMGELKDSAPLYRKGLRSELLQRLEDDGYLFIRGAIGREKAQAARTALIDHLAGKDALVINSKHTKDDAIIKHPSEEGWTVDAESGGFVNQREGDEAIDGWCKVGNSPEVRGVYNGPELDALFRFLWGQPRSEVSDGYRMLPQITWLRAKGKGETTAEHVDYYYFKQNTDTFQDNRHPYVDNEAMIWNDEHPLPSNVPQRDRITCDLCCRIFQASKQVPSATGWSKEDIGEWHCDDCATQPYPLYTTWICLGDYRSFNSTLCVMPKSHTLTQFHKPLRGDLLPEDYNSLVRQKWGWCRADFTLGDIVLFNIKTVHGASKNTLPGFRFSMDTRVSASWIRPRGLFGEPSTLKYTPPIDIIPDDKMTYDGPVNVEPFCPMIDNPKCPVTLNARFIEERRVKNSNKQTKQRKIGSMTGGGGMGGGGMGSGASSRSTKAKQADTDTNDTDDTTTVTPVNDGYTTPLVGGTKAPLPGPAPIGADGVGITGRDDEYSGTWGSIDTDLSQDTSGTECTGDENDDDNTPRRKRARSTRQHRTLRERTALISRKMSVLAEEDETLDSGDEYVHIAPLTSTHVTRSTTSSSISSHGTPLRRSTRNTPQRETA